MQGPVERERRALAEAGRNREVSRTEPAGEELIAVAEVVRPWGLEGGLVVEPLTHAPERLAELVAVSILGIGEPRGSRVTAARPYGERYILWLADATSREAAERLVGARLAVTPEQARPPGESRYYTHDLIGLEVVDEDGAPLGRVREVIATGGTDVFAVDSPELGEILVPATRAIVREISIEQGRMRIAPPEGLVELNRERGGQ